MKMANLSLKVASLALISTLALFVSCKKDSNSGASSTDTNNASTLSTNGASSDNLYDDAFTVALQTGEDNNLDNSIRLQNSGVTTNGSNTTNNTTSFLSSYYCATVTVTATPVDTFPATVKVDFGAGCTSADSITRSGVITYVFSTRFRNPGASITATFDNYTVNGYKLGGTYSVTNNSSVSGISYTTKVTNGSITYPNDSSYTFSGTKTVAQTGGVGSLNLSTWVFSVSGGYTIASAGGQSLTATITTPLVKEWSCKHIVSGITSFIYTDGSLSLNGTLDYGNGTCDNQATVKVGSTTTTVTLF